MEKEEGRDRQDVCVPSAHCVPFIRWNPNLHCDGLRRWDLWGWSGHKASWIGVVPYKKRHEILFSFSLSLILSLPEHTMRGWPSADQDECPHQTMDLLATQSWTSQLLELWEINCCLSPLAYGWVAQTKTSTWTQEDGLPFHPKCFLRSHSWWCPRDIVSLKAILQVLFSRLSKWPASYVLEKAKKIFTY